MPLTPGTRLGAYEITAQIGEGRMRRWARDTKRHRDVALKGRPDSFANDQDRLARFTREAQTLASLNHPNIAQIHGPEESGGVRARVMELVEGETLSQRLVRGAIPVHDVLSVVRGSRVRRDAGRTISADAPYKGSGHVPRPPGRAPCAQLD